MQLRSGPTQKELWPCWRLMIVRVTAQCHTRKTCNDILQKENRERGKPWKERGMEWKRLAYLWPISIFSPMLTDIRNLRRCFLPFTLTWRLYPPFDRFTGSCWRVTWSYYSRLQVNNLRVELPREDYSAPKPVKNFPIQNLPFFSISDKENQVGSLDLRPCHHQIHNDNSR